MKTYRKPFGYVFNRDEVMALEDAAYTIRELAQKLYHAKVKQAAIDTPNSFGITDLYNAYNTICMVMANDNELYESDYEGDD